MVRRAHLGDSRRWGINGDDVWLDRADDGFLTMTSSPQAKWRQTDFDDGEAATDVNGSSGSGFSPARSNRVAASEARAGRLN